MLLAANLQKMRSIGNSEQMQSKTQLPTANGTANYYVVPVKPQSNATIATIAVACFLPYHIHASSQVMSGDDCSSESGTTSSAAIHPLLPLSSHYTLLNQTLLPAFATSLARHSYSIAYAAGVQFVGMALVGIPCHAYFAAQTLGGGAAHDHCTRASSKEEPLPECERERQQSVRDAVRVATLLDELVQAEKIVVEGDGQQGEEVRRLRRLADEAAAREGASNVLCGVDDSCDWTSSIHVNGDESIWDWAATHADLACGRIVDEICSSGPAASHTSSSSAAMQVSDPNKQSADDKNGVPAIRDGNGQQFQEDMERALYLSGVGAAKVASLRAAEKKEAQRRQRRRPRRNAPGRPKPESPSEHSDDGVLVLRQHSALDVDNGATRSQADGRDGPEAESPMSSSLSLSVPHQLRSHHVSRLEAIHARADNCRDDFHSLRKANRIRVYPLNTSQGRVAGSVNGCTVIAPLIAIAHLRGKAESEPSNAVSNGDGRQNGDADMLDDMDWERSVSSSPGVGEWPLINDDLVGVSDRIIQDIIDDDAPSILPSIRTKYNLSGSAFIIPSDVHDFFIDAALLRQDQFVGVSGGNIFDDAHLHSFLRAVNDDTSNRRVAATLFFHEHVICLHRLVIKPKLGDSTEIWYDFIDSLPAKNMLSYDAEAMTDAGQGADGAKDKCGDQVESRDALEGGVDTDGPNALLAEEKGVRVRCSDSKSLFTMLRWYAYSKLTDNDRSYISRCAWNDGNTEFDPRVFQAFIWAGGED